VSPRSGKDPSPPSGPSRVFSQAGPLQHHIRRPAFALPRSYAAGCSYVQASVAYIRNIIPIRAPAGLSRVQSKPLPGRARTPHPPARPDLFHPTSGKKNSANFAVARSTSRSPLGGSGWGRAASQHFSTAAAPPCQHAMPFGLRLSAIQLVSYRLDRGGVNARTHTSWSFV
jgi:hypothetical protein